MTDQPASCACPSLPMHAATCPAIADLWPGVAPSGPAGVSLGGGDTCDASVTAYGGQLVGPCILRHQHNGPVHKAADGTTWITLADGTDPLAPFRALADQYAAKAAESTRNANTAPLTIRTANQGIAAGWRSAEFLLRHTLNNLDNPPASEDAEACCACGGGPVTYQNYRDQLFRKHCSECDCRLPNGKCTVPLCPDCEVRPGELYADGCDAPRCPTTGKQRLSCDRGDACAGHLCRTLWTGRLPTPTPDQYLEQTRLAHNADIILDRVRAIAVDLRNDPDARYWANLLDTALDTPETQSWPA